MAKRVNRKKAHKILKALSKSQRRFWETDAQKDLDSFWKQITKLQYALGVDVNADTDFAAASIDELMAA